MLRGIPHFIAYKGCLLAMQDPLPPPVNCPKVEAPEWMVIVFLNQNVARLILGKSCFFAVNCRHGSGEF